MLEPTGGSVSDPLIDKLRWVAKSRMARSSELLLWLVPGLLLIVGALNIRLAATWAASEAMTLAELFAVWSKGFVPEATYPGAVVLGVDRLSVGTLPIGLALPTALLALSHSWYRRKFAAPLLELLERSGAA
jgi:hypothetical protein